MMIPAGLKNHLISSVTANVACLRLALTRPSWAFGTDLCGVHGPMGWAQLQGQHSEPHCCHWVPADGQPVSA